MNTQYTYKEARDFRDGMALVKLGKKSYYINKNGNMVITCNYDAAWDFFFFFSLVKILKSSSHAIDYKSKVMEIDSENQVFNI